MRNADPIELSALNARYFRWLFILILCLTFVPIPIYIYVLEVHSGHLADIKAGQADQGARLRILELDYRVRLHGRAD